MWTTDIAWGKSNKYWSGLGQGQGHAKGGGKGKGEGKGGIWQRERNGPTLPMHRRKTTKVNQSISSSGLLAQGVLDHQELIPDW